MFCSDPQHRKHTETYFQTAGKRTSRANDPAFLMLLRHPGDAYRIRMHICVRMCTHPYVFACLCLCVFMSVRVNERAYLCLCMLIYVRVYIFMSIHVCVLVFSCVCTCACLCIHVFRKNIFSSSCCQILPLFLYKYS